MQSPAKTVAEYVASLRADRRAAIEAVRQVILKNLDPDIEEGMAYGMIGYYIPHRVFPAGYHCDPKLPLCYAGLGSQKNYMSLYLMACYGSEKQEAWLREQWAKTGKKLDKGKVCIRFKKLTDLPLEVIGEAIRRVSAKSYIAHYEATLQAMKKGSTKNSNRKSTTANAAKAKAAKPITPVRAARKKVPPTRKKPRDAK